MKKHENSIQRAARKERAREVLKKLRKMFPHAGMVLRYDTPWQLLVAVMLSAQCTDKKVNDVTPGLFARCPTPTATLAVSLRELEKMIRPTGFFRLKATRIREAAEMILGDFHGEVPRTMDELLRVPGVARKTANVVLGNAYGVVDGIAVDTHVGRLARVFGLSDEIDPGKVERDLMEVIPRAGWFRATYLLIEYGRKYCSAKPHDHDACPLGGTYRASARTIQAVLHENPRTFSRKGKGGV